MDQRFGNVGGLLLYVHILFLIIYLHEINNNNRQQMIHLGIKPFTNSLIQYRTKRLREAFPQYDEKMLHGYVESQSMA